MATIKLTRVKCKNLTTKEDMWRLGVKSIGNVSAEDFVKHASEHCDVKIGTLRASLAAFVDSAKLFLSMGHGVQLGDLGTLQLTVTSKATKREEDLTAKNLTGVNVRLRPIGDLAKEIKNFKFSVVGAVSEEEDGGTGTIDPNAPTGTGSNGSQQDPNQNQQGTGTNGGQNSGSNQNSGSQNQGIDFDSIEGPADPTKVKLVFITYSGSQPDAVVGSKEVEPGHRLASDDLPAGYAFLLKESDQRDLDSETAGGIAFISVAATA